MFEDERYAEKVKGYDLDSLLDIKDHIDREKSPERYALLMEEIAKRKRQLETEQLAGKAGHVHASAGSKTESFDGKTFRYSDQTLKRKHKQYRTSLLLFPVMYFLIAFFGIQPNQHTIFAKFAAFVCLTVLVLGLAVIFWRSISKRLRKSVVSVSEDAIFHEDGKYVERMFFGDITLIVAKEKLSTIVALQFPSIRLKGVGPC